MYSVHIQINSTDSDQDPKMRRKHQNKTKNAPLLSVLWANLHSQSKKKSKKKEKKGGLEHYPKSRWGIRKMMILHAYTTAYE